VPWNFSRKEHPNKDGSRSSRETGRAKPWAWCRRSPAQEECKDKGADRNERESVKGPPSNNEHCSLRNHEGGERM